MTHEEKMLTFMGRVDKHMEYSNELQKDYIFDRKDIYDKIHDLDNKQAKLEIKQTLIVRVGSFIVISIVGFFTRGYWMKH